MGSPLDRAPWLGATTQVLVGDVSAPKLDDASYHHLSKVLRLRKGQTVCASDGVGGWAMCEFDGSSTLVSTGSSGREPAPEPTLTVGFALVKASKPELVVQKLTELGIDQMVVFQARNSVVRWDAGKVERQIERLRKIVVEACAQSRRLHQPTVSFGDLAGASGWTSAAPDGSTPRVVLADVGGRPLKRSDTVVLIGPEGGWDPSEARIGERISLGTTVLRAETAAIAAATQMTALRSGLLSESP